jgi:hypothetical protein
MGSGIVRSTDKGMTWNLSNSGLTNLTVRTISKLANGLVLVGTEKGGFLSNDHGLTWSGVTTSAPFGTVRSIFIDSEGKIYLVTDAGLYKTMSIASAHTVEQPIPPNSIYLCQNYPNPFNPSTTISFSIVQRAGVSLKIYDCLGRNVATLVEGVREAGQHQVPFDASALSSGMYFYRLTAGEFAATKKMIIAR